MDNDTLVDMSEEFSPINDLISKFTWIDYSVLAGMLIFSCGIGLFFKCIEKKNSSSDDFLLGGANNPLLPMCVSLATSFLTAVEMLGNPVEIYKFGTQFWAIVIAFFLVVPICDTFYLPVFMNLRYTSCFEYLEHRFSKSVRVIASLIYIIQMLIYTAISVYAPALALSKFTGLNTYISVVIIYAVCIFYSSQGGMKAVIFTDLFQAAVLVTSLVVVLILGANAVGNYADVWSESYHTGRLSLFNMDPSVTTRHNFWSVAIGGTVYWLSMFCANQASIQKYLTVKKASQVKKALWFTAFFMSAIYSLLFYIGMILAVEYKNCDPIQNNDIGTSDELLPLFVINTLGDKKGIPGLFVAGIFAASLGTVAAALTSVSAAVFQDFSLNRMNKNSSLMVKCMTIGAGVISFCLIFVIEHLGGVLQMALSFNGVIGGVTLGLFTLGMFFPWANNKGALTGATISFIFVTTICAGAQLYAKEFEEKSLAVVSGCGNYSITPEVLQSEVESSIVSIFKISYLWYASLGSVSTILIGLIVSLITTPMDLSKLSYTLMSPPILAFYRSLPTKLKVILQLHLISELEIRGDQNSQ